MRMVYIVKTSPYTDKGLAVFEDSTDALAIAAQLHGTEEAEKNVIALPYIPTEHAQAVMGITGGEHGE